MLAVEPGAHAVKQELGRWQRANPLRAWREANNLTVMDAAIMLNVSQVTVRSWENGATQPKGENLERIAALVGNGDVEGALRLWKNWVAQRPA